jgi:hypothetical protein
MRGTLDLLILMATPLHGLARPTRAGRKQLQVEDANWRRIALAMTHAPGSTS